MWAERPRSGREAKIRAGGQDEGREAKIRARGQDEGREAKSWTRKRQKPLCLLETLPFEILRNILHPLNHRP